MKELTAHIEMRKHIFNVSAAGFEALALKIFHFQYEHNEFYRLYCDSLSVPIDVVQTLQQIPFLPIQFFKSRIIKTTSFEPAIIFESSGTTGSVNSKHFIKDIGIYEESFLETFKMFYGDIKQYCVLGLLPSYLERQHSSLVWMVKDLINKSDHPTSGFYLYDHIKLQETIVENERNGQQTLLIGVTYALLDFFAAFPQQLKHTIIMETGGMKGRKEEQTRSSIHELLRLHAGVSSIHSEYGMTELLSQAYSKCDGLFNAPAWMKILLRAEDDPFEIKSAETIHGTFSSGVINVIDLANIYSCSFIATDDMGKLYPDGSFEVLGRLDNSDIRGCSLMLLP